MIDEKHKREIRPLTATIQSFMHSSAGELEKQRDVFRAKYKHKFADSKWLKSVSVMGKYN